VIVLYRHQQCPVPSDVLLSYDNDRILQVLLNCDRLHKHYISSTNPVRVQNNHSFIVDLDLLKDPEDILSDDLGAWEQTKTRSKWYQVKFAEDGNASKVTKVKDKTEGSYQVCRRPFVNKSDKSFKKNLVNVILPNGENFHLVLARYHFEGRPEHAIQVVPHGNSKQSTIPYLRTYKSTRNKLKETVANEGSGIKKVLHEVEKSVGGLQECTSQGALPRSERQVKYVKKDLHPTVEDPILEITQKMKLAAEGGGEKFVRCYSLDDDSPKVVLFTDSQVDDIVNFCCSEILGHKSLLYADVTFQLGPFFVLMTTYKNMTLYTKGTNPPTCPIMIGPIMLCMLKDKATYLTLFQKLTAKVPGLKVYLQGYSTDSEESLRQSMAQEFERAVSFLCKVHMQRNIQDKCRALKMSQRVVDTVVSDIFGSAGLTSAETEEEFNCQLDKLMSKWDNLENADTNNPPKFSRYFRVYKRDDIWYHVSAKVLKSDRGVVIYGIPVYYVNE